MKTLVQQFETMRSQITVQSTAANKAKLTFQMIKLKHYHHVPNFFFFPLPEITTTGLPVHSWQGKSPSMISVQSCRAEGAEGAKLAAAHLERAKCLFHSDSMHSGDYCDGTAVATVVWL